MTLMLAALWIAGHEFHWWWFAVSVLVDLVFMALKLNFLTVLIRRSIEDAKLQDLPPAAMTPPPSSTIVPPK